MSCATPCLHASELKHRITIQQRSTALDEYGQATETWATLQKVWSKIKPLSGDELFQAQQVHAKVTHQIEMRYLSTLTTQMRIVYRSRIFHIVSAINVNEDDVRHLLMCREVLE